MYARTETCYIIQFRSKLQKLALRDIKAHTASRTMQCKIKGRGFVIISDFKGPKRLIKGLIRFCDQITLESRISSTTGTKLTIKT